MNFLKTTLIGGILFLIPISICILILGKAHKVMVKLAAPRTGRKAGTPGSPWRCRLAQEANDQVLQTAFGDLDNRKLGDAE